MENSFLEAALNYAGLGWHVFPLAPKAKYPITQNGFKDATNDVTKIIDWWTKLPNANIGISTGKVSGIFVVDIDGECPEEFLKLLSPTLKVKSFRGFHYYFRYPRNQSIKSRNRVNGLPLDIKSDGGYIVAPPSVHPDGGIYEFTS